MSADVSTVVYLVLGSSRMTAARAYCDQLAADGVRVDVIVPDCEEWRDYHAPGVSVHLLPPGKPARLRQRARSLLRRGLLDRASLVVAGNLDAAPLALWVRRRRPDLPVKLEAVAGPDRPSPADLAVLTPWHPSPNNSMSGSFVEAATAAVRSAYDSIVVIQNESWSTPGDWWSAALAKAAWRRLRAAGLGSVGQETANGRLIRVPVPRLSGPGYVAWIADHIEAMRAALPTGRIEAPLIHAHTGIYGGVLAARFGRPDARVIITEHSSFLAAIFTEPGARALFDEALSRADEMLCVGGVLRDQIAAEFPHHASKLRVVPNVIDFDRFAGRPRPVSDLLRWLYVGRFLELKGVHTVLEAFALIARDEPAATLTLVGSGPLETFLRNRVGQLGLAGRVEIRPLVRPTEVPTLMHNHDLLVHASRMETFGMTTVEAVAAGLPVLVGRSPGPEETLAGLEGVAGLLFDVDDDPETLAHGYRKLRVNFADLDMKRARQVMESRFGREAVGRQLLDSYCAVTPTASGRTAGRTVVIALDPPDPQVAADAVLSALSTGTAVDLVVDKPSRELEPGVRLHVVPARQPSWIARAGWRTPWVAIEALFNVADRAVQKSPLRRAAVGRVKPDQVWAAISDAVDWTTVREAVLLGKRSAAVGRCLADAHPHVVTRTTAVSGA